MAHSESRRYDGMHCTMEIAVELNAPAPTVLVVRIAGSDVGEFGDEPLRHLERLLEGVPSARLFIDARGTAGATVEVSGGWAAWLRKHRDRLESVHMLTGSRLVRVTAEFVRRFAGLGALMTIHHDPASFDGALAAARRSN